MMNIFKNKNSKGRESIVKNVSVTELSAPLIQPFRTALGEHDTLENVLFSLELEDGTKGFGEAAIATHITGETVLETIENLKSFGSRLIGEDIADYLRLSWMLNEQFAKNKAAVAAVEMSVLDALTRQWKIPLWKLFGSRPQKLVTDITIVIASLPDTEDAVKRFLRQGFRTFKVKIGRDQDEDLKRVLSVRRLARYSKIILDVNQGYSAEETLNFLRMLDRAGIRPVLIEQPVPKDDWEGLKRVSRSTRIPVCADESISTVSQTVKAIREKAVPAINIKLMKSGLIQAREIAVLARGAGIKLMIGGMMESSLAMTASAHLASGLSCFDFIDLDTPFFIKPGHDKNPFLSRNGVYDVRRVRSGIGIVP